MKTENIFGNASEEVVEAKTVKKATKTTAKKAATKKTTAKAEAKKTEAKKEDVKVAKKETKKTTTKATAAKDIKKSVFIEYQDNQIDTDAIMKKVLADCKKAKVSPKKINLYFKPEDNACYYVADDFNGKIDLF